MTNNLPLVSVIMPNYNTAEEFLRASIESVLGQTYRNIEFIIIDDASTGNDVEIIRSYRDKRIILLRNEKNMHISYSLNRGLDIANGEYIARMDSDDLCLPERIEKQVRLLQRRRDIGILCAQVEMIGERNGVFATNIKNPEIMKAELFFNCLIVHPSVMFRASFVNENSIQFNEDGDYRAAEDYELWSRCIFIGKICEYPQVLMKYRIHKKQVSASAKVTQIESAKRVRKNMLSKLGITPDLHEADIHLNFCTESASPEIKIGETHDWARRLLDGNKRYSVFQEQRFMQMVLRHFFVIAYKSLLRKQASLRQVFKMPLTFQALSPIYYPGYVKRYLFSRIFNRFP